VTLLGGLFPRLHRPQPRAPQALLLRGPSGDLIECRRLCCVIFGKVGTLYEFLYAIILQLSLTPDQISAIDQTLFYYLQCCRKIWLRRGYQNVLAAPLKRETATCIDFTEAPKLTFEIKICDIGREKFELIRAL